MKYIFFISFLLGQFTCWSQNQLVNKYSTWHEMHGGMEGSGISRTESYIFVAKKTVKIKGIYLNDAEIVLNANDTLYINVFSNRGGDWSADTDNSKLEQPELKKRFVVMKKNRTYYASPAFPYQWPKSVEYMYKKRTYTAPTKKEFDKGESAYAP